MAWILTGNTSSMTPAHQQCESTGHWWDGPVWEIERRMHSLILAWVLNESACTRGCPALHPSQWRHLSYAATHRFFALPHGAAIFCCQLSSYLDQSQSTALQTATRAWTGETRAARPCGAQHSETCSDSQVATAWEPKVGTHNREASRGVKLMFDGAFTASEVSFA